MRNADLQFYLDQAEHAREEAKVATLAHVRERCHRSEAAWTALAERAACTKALRNEYEQMKSEDPPE